MEVIMEERFSNIFKVLSDPNRLKIIELLIKGETCGCTLIHKLPITQPTLSYHLKTLTDIGLTVSYKEGTQMKYYVDKEKLEEVIKFLVDLKESKEVCNS